MRWGEESDVRRLLCFVVGHHQTQAIFSSTRFYCDRCGLALDSLPYAQTPGLRRLEAPYPAHPQVMHSGLSRRASLPRRR